MGERSGSRASLLASPWFVGSILLLAVNDHLLKDAWPGWVTGKLSDAAGVAMVAIGLTALIGRRPTAFGLAAAAFAVLKTVPLAATWAAPVLGGATRTDPTDLLALVVLVPLWTAVGTDRGDGSTGLAWRVVWVVAAVGVTTATSCEPGGVYRLAVDGERVHAFVDGDVWTSADGGASWARARGDALDSVRDHRRCAGDRCFDIVRDRGDVRVVAVTAGDPEILLEWSDDDADELADAVDWTCGAATFVELVVVEARGTVHVVVSMTEAGTLRWSGATGSWEWVAVGEAGVDADSIAGIPVATAADHPWYRSTWPGRTVLVLTTFGAAAASVWIASLVRRSGRSQNHVAAAVAVMLASVVPLVGLTALFDGRRDGAALLLAAVFVAVPVATSLGLIAALAARPRRRLPPPDADRRLG